MATGEAYLVDLRKGFQGRVELTEDEQDEEYSKYVLSDLRFIKLIFFFDSFPSCAMTVARFDPSGKHIFIGTSQGTICVFNTRTKAVRTSFRMLVLAN